MIPITSRQRIFNIVTTRWTNVVELVAIRRPEVSTSNKSMFITCLGFDYKTSVYCWC